MTQRAVRALVLLALVAGIGAAAPAASAGPLADKRPLVYVVVIDGLDGDKVEAGQAPFISSLLSGQGASATYFPDSSSVIPAETNPNHTAMMSGALPGSSGIPANAFALYSPLESADSCVATGPVNFALPPNETSGESASCPEAQFTFEAIEQQGNPDDVSTAAIFGKPKLGRIFAGQNVEPGRRDVDHLWAPCDSAPDDDEYCGQVTTNPVTGYADTDSTVMDEVLRTADAGINADEGVERPDLSFVNLHQVDSAGHATGTGSVYDAAIALADIEIRRLVDTLRARGEWERSVLMLVSDHSMDTTPQRVNLTGAFEDGGVASDQFTVVQNGSTDLVYLNDRQGAGGAQLLARMRQIALAESGVSEALYRVPNDADGGAASTVDAVHPTWGSAGERSGDLLVTAKPSYAFTEPSQFSNPLPGNHGAPQTADNFMAVIGGGGLVAQGTSTGGPGKASGDAAPKGGPATNADVASTAMGLFGLFPTADNQGRFLVEAFDPAALKACCAPYPPQLSSKRARGGKPIRLPGARPKTRKRKLTITPGGGLYDLEVKKGKSWRPLLTETDRTKLKVRGKRGRRYQFRVRSYAASGVASDWLVTRVRFR